MSCSYMLVPTSTIVSIHEEELFFNVLFGFNTVRARSNPIEVCGILGGHFVSYRGRNDRLGRRTHQFLNEVVDSS